MADADGNNFFKPLGDAFLAENHDRRNRMSHTHVHSVYELYFCPVSAAHQCVICGEEFEYDNPCIILTKPYAIHAMWVNTPWPKGRSWYVFSFSESTAAKSGMQPLLEEILEENLGMLFRLSQAQADYLETAVRFLFDPEHPLGERDALSMFSFFLCRLQSLCAKDQTVGVGSANYCTQLVMQRICENFQSALTGADLAREFCVSRSKLDRDFKNAIGVTPKDFMGLCRLRYAKQLLVYQRDIKVSQIARLCGFPSENYFYRFFRQHTGMTPIQYKSADAKKRHV